MLTKSAMLDGLSKYTKKIEASLTTPNLILPTTNPTVNGSLAMGDNNGTPALKLYYNNHIYYFNADSSE